MKYFVFLFGLCLSSLGVCAGTFYEGKQLAFARNKGNCLACHAIADGEDPGNIGPPINDVAIRFKNKAFLRDQIWDATQFNPETSMPPFGKNEILTDQEIDKIVDFLWTL